MSISPAIWNGRRFLRLERHGRSKNANQEYTMSVIDKIVAAVTPPESEEARADARLKANAAARPGDWLSQVLQ